MKVKQRLNHTYEKLLGTICAKLFTVKMHSSIDYLPVFNWWKIHSTGDYSFLLIEQKKVNRFQVSALEKCWKKIYAEYIDRFGFSELFLRMIEKRREIALLKLRKVETDDDSLQIFIEVAKQELDDMKKDSGSGDFYESKVSMEKILGFHFDAAKMSVAEFYSYINHLKKRSKQ